MAISMYHASVPVFLQLLGGLKGVIEKAEAHSTAHKWEESTVLNLRLYPDNLPDNVQTTMMGLVNAVMDNMP